MMNALRTMTLLVLSLAGSLAVGEQAELEIIAVTQQTIDVEHRLDGVVEAVNEATLTAEIAGGIAEVLFDVGDVVPAGAVVIRLRGTEQKAEVSAAEARVVDARARIIEARMKSPKYQRLTTIRIMPARQPPSASTDWCDSTTCARIRT